MSDSNDIVETEDLELDSQEESFAPEDLELTDDSSEDEGNGIQVEESEDESEAADAVETEAPNETEKEAVSTSKDEDSQDVDDDAQDEPGSWYVVHTQSGFEMKATESLQQRIKSLGFEDKIFDIIVPRRDVVTVKGGKKRASKEKVFPGYILVRMILDNDSWLVVRTTQGITGFVGAGTKPTPISDNEVKAIMKFVKQDQPKFKAKFSLNEAVKVTDGPFSDFVGTINHIDEDKGRVTVLVSIFGRETPVELDFLQISKL